MNTKILSLAIGALSLSASSAFGIISITNFSIVADTINFDISGDIEVGAVLGTTSLDAFFIGVPGDNDWVTVAGAVGTVVNHGGGNSVFLDAGFYLGDVNGNYITIAKAGTWAIGDSVDATVTISGGTLVAGNLNELDLIVTAGFDSSAFPFPDAANTVGGAIPEPSTYAVFAGLAVLGLVAIRRRKR